MMELCVSLGDVSSLPIIIWTPLSGSRAGYLRWWGPIRGLFMQLMGTSGLAVIAAPGEVGGGGVTSPPQGTRLPYTLSPYAQPVVMTAG